MKKLFAMLMMVLSLVGCVPQPSVSRTISLRDNSNGLVQIPNVTVARPRSGGWVAIDAINCGVAVHSESSWLDQSVAFESSPSGLPNYSRQVRFIGTDFGNFTNGWKVYIPLEQFKRFVVFAARSGCDISNLVVVYTVYAAEQRPVVVVNEHITE